MGMGIGLRMRVRILGGGVVSATTTAAAAVSAPASVSTAVSATPPPRVSQMSVLAPHQRKSDETARGEDDNMEMIMGHGDVRGESALVGQQHDRRTSNVSVETWEMGRAL
jgi:hypothetical protein